MSPPAESFGRPLLNTGVRIDPDVRKTYMRAVRAKHPHFDLDFNKAIRMHMSEVAAEYEAEKKNGAKP